MTAGASAAREAAALYRAALEGDVEEFDASGLDVLGLPVWSVTHRPPGQTGPAAGRLGGGGWGYGPDGDAALTGAYGELVEVACSVAVLRPTSRPQASLVEMTGRHGADRVADPRTLGLEAGSDWSPDRPLQWLPTRRLGGEDAGDDAVVWAPAELVASTGADLPGTPPPGGWLTTPISNGLGAGAGEGARERAVAHALLEVCQRDGNGLRFRALDRGVVLSLEGSDVADDPVVAATLRRCAEAGLVVLPKLATTEHGLANVHVVGHGAADGADDVDADLPVRATACGEAAHPDRVVALRKALLEFCAARTRKAFTHGSLDRVREVASPAYVARYLDGGQTAPDRMGEEPRALAGMVDWLSRDVASLRGLLAPVVHARRTSVPVTDLPGVAPGSVDAPADLLADVRRRLGGSGLHEVLVADLPGAPGSRVHAVKVLVPGAEVEVMSYGRVGERTVRALREADDVADAARDLVAVGDRPAGPGWAAVHLTDAAQERLGGPAWFDRSGADALVGDLYPLYREPGRHAAQRALGPGRVAA